MKTFKLPTLYHKSKTGAICEWTVSTQEDQIFTRWGQVDGALQTTGKQAIPKNVGRSNETTAEEQAQLEAKALWQYKLDRKYSLTPEEAQETVFLPMLAHDFKKEKKIEYPVYVQPKLDGIRTMIWKDELEQVHLMSRSGKPYNLPHIANALSDILWPGGMVLDGELYKHGTSLQQINSLVKKNKPGLDGSESISFWVFDLYSEIHPNLNFEKRLELLKDTFVDSIFGPKASIKQITVVPTELVHSAKDIKELLYQYMQQGFEGCIIRKPDGPYELGHRSHGLLKLKEFQDAEFKVIGAYGGKGKFEGCVTWICLTEDGKEFSCTPRGTLEQKKEWLANKDKYINKMLTIKFQQRSDDNIPIFPVGIGFRLEEDLP